MFHCITIIQRISLQNPLFCILTHIQLDASCLLIMHVYIVEQKSGDRHFFKLSINLILDAAAVVALKSDDPMNE